jgi:membrane-bound lytic murein transglycosylase B
VRRLHGRDQRAEADRSNDVWTDAMISPTRILGRRSRPRHGSRPHLEPAPVQSASTPERKPATARAKHASPSLLTPSRAFVVGGAAAGVAVAIVAGCATVAHSHGSGSARAGQRQNPAHALVRPVDAAVFAQGALAAAAPAGSVAPTPGAPVGDLAIDPSRVGPDSAPVSGLAESGIPATALAAYEIAAARETLRDPACGITWPLLGGIGRVESNHGRFAGAVLHADGVSTPRIIGIPLDGHGTALIRDTDGGRVDGDPVYDRAVGPMQFIPSTWAGWGVDANHDGTKDPFNIFDAAAAAADYLCAAGHDLRTSAGQVKAILTYNYSYDYVSMVMGLERVYASQTGVTVPVLPTLPAEHGRPVHKPSLPPVDPGRPKGVTDQPKHPKPIGGSSSSSAGSSSSAQPGGGSSSSSSAASDPATNPVTDPGTQSSSSTDPAPDTSSATSSDPATGTTSTCTTPTPTDTTSSAPTDPCASPTGQSAAVANAALDSSAVTSTTSATETVAAPVTETSPGADASTS